MWVGFGQLSHLLFTGRVFMMPQIRILLQKLIMTKLYFINHKYYCLQLHIFVLYIVNALKIQVSKSGKLGHNINSAPMWGCHILIIRALIFMPGNF
jgi:hypothetical protein